MSGVRGLADVPTHPQETSLPSQEETQAAPRGLSVSGKLRCRSQEPSTASGAEVAKRSSDAFARHAEQSLRAGLSRFHIATTPAFNFVHLAASAKAGNRLYYAEVVKAQRAKKLLNPTGPTSALHTDIYAASCSACAQASARFLLMVSAPGILAQPAFSTKDLRSHFEVTPLSS